MDNWRLLTRLVFIYTLGPFVLGYAIFWIIHHLAGVIANIISGDDDAALERIMYKYIYSVTRLKEITFPWALGLGLLLLVGVIQ